MNDRMKFVVKFLEERCNDSFYGAVKFGIERGSIVSVGEANSYDSVLYTDELINNEKLMSLLSPCFKTSFNGTFIFRINDGRIDGYAYSRTFKGDDLKRLMGLS